MNEQQKQAYFLDWTEWVIWMLEDWQESHWVHLKKNGYPRDFGIVAMQIAG